MVAAFIEQRANTQTCCRASLSGVDKPLSQAVQRRTLKTCSVMLNIRMVMVVNVSDKSQT